MIANIDDAHSSRITAVVAWPGTISRVRRPLPGRELRKNNSDEIIAVSFGVYRPLDIGQPPQR